MDKVCVRCGKLFKVNLQTNQIIDKCVFCAFIEFLAKDSKIEWKKVMEVFKKICEKSQRPLKRMLEG